MKQGGNNTPYFEATTIESNSIICSWTPASTQNST